MFNDTARSASAEGLGRVGDITITLEAELDRTTLSFKDVASWAPGSLLRLPSSAGEAVTIHAGNVRFGSGEVLLVDGVMTVRVSELAALPAMPDSEEPR